MEMVRRKACAVSLCNNDSKHSHVRFGLAQLLQEESPQNHEPDFREAPAEIVSDDSDFWFYFYLSLDCKVRRSAGCVSKNLNLQDIQTFVFS